MTFDSNGNRNGGSYTTQYNRMTADANWTYGYDYSGRLTQKTTTAGGSSESWTYAWSASSRLTEVKHYDSSGTLDLTVDYDAFGEMIQRDNGTIVERFIIDGGNSNMPRAIGNENRNVVAILDGSNTWKESYLWSDKVDQQLGRVVLSANNFALWPLKDRLGSVRDIINSAGTLRDSIKYDGWGNITAETDPTYCGWYAWTGRQLDAETELQYNRARWYDPKMGRWISQDPLGFDAGDTNLYRYVKNGPTYGTDPSGLDAFVTGTSSHTGIAVTVRDGKGNVVGILSADYGAKNFQENPNVGILDYVGPVFHSSAQILFGYHPIDSANARTIMNGRRITGTAQRDNALVVLILEQVGEGRKILNEKIAANKSQSWKQDVVSRRWRSYSVFADDTCHSFTWWAFR